MRKGTKIAVGITLGVCAIPLLPYLVIAPFVASNLVAGVGSMIFNRNPTKSEIVGTYLFRGDGDRSTMQLSADGSFSEQLVRKDGTRSDIAGTWNMRYDSYDTDVTFSTFLNPTDSAKAFDRSSGTVAMSNFTVLSYKPRLGATYLSLDPDTGDRYVRTGN